MGNTSDGFQPRIASPTRSPEKSPNGNGASLLLVTNGLNRASISPDRSRRASEIRRETIVPARSNLLPASDFQQSATSTTASLPALRRSMTRDLSALPVLITTEAPDQQQLQQRVVDVQPRVSRELFLYKGRPRVLIHAREVTLRGNGLSNTGRRIKTTTHSDGRSLPYVGGSSALTGVQYAPPTFMSALTAETRAVMLIQRHVRGWLARRAFQRRVLLEAQKRAEYEMDAEHRRTEEMATRAEHMRRRREDRESRRRDWADAPEEMPEPVRSMEIGVELLNAVDLLRDACRRLQDEVDRQMEMVLAGDTGAAGHHAPRMVAISNKMPLPKLLRDAILPFDPEGGAVISVIYDSEHSTPESFIKTLLDLIKTSGVYCRVKSLALVVPCETGMAEVLFRLPSTAPKIFKDPRLQFLYTNIGNLVSKVERSTSRIHFLGSNWICGGESERGNEMLIAIRKYSNVTAEAPLEMAPEGVETLSYYFDATRYQAWRQEAASEVRERLSSSYHRASLAGILPAAIAAAGSPQGSAQGSRRSLIDRDVSLDRTHDRDSVTSGVDFRRASTLSATSTASSHASVHPPNPPPPLSSLAAPASSPALLSSPAHPGPNSSLRPSSLSRSSGPPASYVA